MKVGDRVRITGDEYNNKTFIGKTGEIVGVFTHSKSYDYVVQFEDDNSVDLHDGNSTEEAFNFDPTKHNKRWFAKEHLELVTDPLWNCTVGLDNPIECFTTRVLCADDIVCAKTSYDLRDVLSTIKGNNEENYMELLNIYEKRTEVAIDKKYDKKIKKVLAEDANMKIWQECFDKLASLFEKNPCGTLREYDIRRPEPLDDTKVKIKELEQQRGDEMMKLRTTIREIEAQLCLCETRDDKLEVLRIYNVLDEEGKINA